jgi:aminoglycoside/choline kinase family phosphotransferase
VPARVGADEAAGIELLEDVGSLPLAAAAGAAGAGERRALYEETCDLVPRIQRIADPGGVAAFARRLDEALLAYKAQLLCEQVVSPRAGAAAAATARAAMARVAEELRAAPLRLAHRDLQSANVHVRAGRPPGARLVLIDLQGAFLAPPEYDLVCLLRDSYVELPAEEVAHQLERIRSRLPDAPGAEELARRFDLLTLSRKGKDLARFLYAARARGDDRYLRFVPATLGYLRSAAARAAARDPAFAAFAEILAALPEDACAR